MSKDISDALEALMGGSRYGGVPLYSPKPRGSQPAQKSSVLESGSIWQPDPNNTLWAEDDISKREYGPDQLITTTDGLLTLCVRPLHYIEFRNKEGKRMSLLFENPPATP